MPRVVIELQANTQDAVNKIQQFARAQKDAFDAIKAGSPALQDATVKVSKLTEATSLSSKAAAEFNRTAKNLAAGGVRELVGQVPILGSALANLATQLTGMPLLLAAAGAAAYGVVSHLKDLEAQLDKTAKAVGTLSEKASREFLAMTQRVAALKAEAAGLPEVAAGIRLKATERGAEATKQEELAAARTTREGAISTTDKLQALLNPQAFFDKLKIADAAYQDARAAAEIKANATITEAREKYKLDIQKIEADLDKQLADLAEKRVADAAKAAEQQQQLLQDLAEQSLKIFQGLGEGFKDVTQSLQLAQFIKDSTAAIGTLQQAMDAGLDTTGRFGAGIKALQERMAEAIQLGYVPTVAAAQQVTAAIGQADAATRQFTATQNALRTAMAVAGSLPGTTRGATPADIALKGAAISALAPRTGIDVPGRGIYEPAWQPAWAKPSRPAGAPMALQAFQAGGLVPGVGPVPILAHGGERIVPAHAAGGGDGALVRIEPGAIQISGTLIQQSRDWDVLVESLGQALAARLR